jgi:hypothetical protein
MLANHKTRGRRKCNVRHGNTGDTGEYPEAGLFQMK